MMETALIILILFTNPDAAGDAQMFATQLESRASVELDIRSGVEAETYLLSLAGIQSTDLVAAGGMGQTLTEHNRQCVIIHMNREERSGDVVAEMRLWYDGQDESFVVIAGNGGDPVPLLMSGIQRLIGYKIQRGMSSGDVDATGRKLPLSALVTAQAWTQLLVRIAAITPAERAPIQHYYQVMAYVHLTERDEAVDCLNAFRLQFPQHILVRSAEALIPPMKAKGTDLDGIGSVQSIDPLLEPMTVENPPPATADMVPEKEAVLAE